MLFDSPNLTDTRNENDFFYNMNINNLTTIALIFVSLLLTSCHTDVQQPTSNQSKQMNTTSPVFIGHKLTTKPMKLQRQIDNNMVEYSGDMYEQILEYYDHQTVYFPL